MKLKCTTKEIFWALEVAAGFRPEAKSVDESFQAVKEAIAMDAVRMVDGVLTLTEKGEQLLAAEDC